MSDRHSKPYDGPKESKHREKNVRLYSRSVHSCDSSTVGHDLYPYSRDQAVGNVQLQKQVQRSAEASKHMVFGVFGNVIKILEEFERRENELIGKQQAMPQSKIAIANQRDKDFDDIESLVNTQLLLFETQTKVCPPEVLVEVKDMLKQMTIRWAAVREEMGIHGVHKTDIFMAKLYEILAKGKTQHNIPTCSGVTEQVMKESFPSMMKGIHDKNMVDKAYKEDKTRKAMVPDTRSSGMIYEGAHRIAKASGNRDLGTYLQNDVDIMQSEHLDTT